MYDAHILAFNAECIARAKDSCRPRRITRVAVFLGFLAASSPAAHAATKTTYADAVNVMAFVSEYVVACPEGQDYKTDLLKFLVNTHQVSGKDPETIAHDIAEARKPLDELMVDKPDDHITICDGLHMKLIEGLGH